MNLAGEANEENQFFRTKAVAIILDDTIEMAKHYIFIRVKEIKYRILYHEFIWFSRRSLLI